MGACDFSNYGQGSDPREVFTRLVEDARFEHGHGGYTGTIAEKGSYVIVSKEPMTMSEAHRFAGVIHSYDMDDDATEKDPFVEKVKDTVRRSLGHRADLGDLTDKWGSANAIPVLSDEKVVRRARQVTVTVRKDGYLDPADLHALAADAVTVKNGETIETVEIIKDETRRKAEVTTGEGSTQQRFFITPAGRFDIRGDGYASQAAARAALTAQLKAQVDSPHHWSAAYEIVGVTRRCSGDALVKGSLLLKSRKVTLKVTLRKQSKSGTADIAGWLFFGYASS